jgi:hypothetical protein
VAGTTLTVFGRFALAEDHSNVGRLLALEWPVIELAVEGGARRRCQISGTLSPDGSERREVGKLRTVLWRLSSILICGGLVRAKSGRFRLAPRVEIDLYESRCYVEDIRRGDPAPPGRSAPLGRFGRRSSQRPYFVRLRAEAPCATGRTPQAVLMGDPRGQPRSSHRKVRFFP